MQFGRFRRSGQHNGKDGEDHDQRDNDQKRQNLRATGRSCRRLQMQGSCWCGCPRLKEFIHDRPLHLCWRFLFQLDGHLFITGNDEQFSESALEFAGGLHSPFRSSFKAAIQESLEIGGSGSIRSQRIVGIDQLLEKFCEVRQISIDLLLQHP